ncbi:ATPase AAA [Mesomycoplasma conjunctivae]|uniref:AAA family ATPase n=1 Tax=Mesomycoplasma conjunctivae (strain ATCC 25834 / NCTC 10147 / HRC/581) TaxID=572263 RepID=C5J6T5_MESCH|nr:ATP-binding protein [Mesomycoplasma conjunctivae]CAT05198.1 AAA family ATPase [Mesomycoplasma conjunctivae]VEU66409.1 ATPase AAA [Mesomycoplasma conjunctivae]
MKKKNVINLIKYYVDRNENSFRNEAIEVARAFDRVGDYELSEYIMSLIAEMNLQSVKVSDLTSKLEINFEGQFLKPVKIKNLDNLTLPLEITEDIQGIINAINHNIGINKFLFEGLPGTGKTEAAKNITRLLGGTLFIVSFDNLIDSKLGETIKNITKVFEEINRLPNTNKIVVLFDEIDVIALDRISSNDVREMGRATSTILRELDRLTEFNKEIILIATTNLYSNLDKALIRRFDATIDFNKYSNEDLIKVAEYYFNSFIKNFKGISKDTKLFKKILQIAGKLPSPGELKNIIKTSLAFSKVGSEYDYLKRLYKSLIGNLSAKSTNQLQEEGFTVKEIEKLKMEYESEESPLKKDKEDSQ